MAATLKELAALVNGRIVGDGAVAIQAARPVTAAGPGDITFLADERYGKVLRVSPASAALVGPHFNRVPWTPQQPFTWIEVDDPQGAFLAIHAHLNANQSERWTGIAPQAIIDPSAKIGKDVAIYPLVTVGVGAVIGDGCTLHSGARVGARCVLGQGVTLHPNVVLYHEVTLGDRVEIHAGTVIGSEGFGYRLVNGRHVKVPQTGTVEIGDDVEIGANCAIDRGTFEPTRIGTGTKLDNLVQIGHNTQVGRHNIVCGQTGLAGSCKTGEYVMMGGQVGLKDHITVGDRALIAAQAGVTRNVPENGQVFGTPAAPLRNQRRVYASLSRLPQMQQKLREVAAQVAALAASARFLKDEGAGEPNDSW